MCGICGFTGALEGEVDRATLKAMCDVMAHRGPDGEGQYIADGIALGHRRLSLIDLEGGGQPMVRETGDHASAVTTTAVMFEHVRGEAAQVAAASHSETARAAAFQRGQWSIVYNGEIYNYRELRAELQALGYEFTTNSDTEVLLVGYIAWSESVLQRLRGMFAFAIYDAETQELFCARDFFGIKPFYYAVVDTANAACSTAQSATSDDALTVPGEASATPGMSATRPAKQFVFASEIKSILEHPAYERELNEDALAQYLCFQFSALHETFFKGIFKLPPGHCLRVRAAGEHAGEVEIGRYWKPEYDFDENRPESKTVDAIDAVMRESVRFHNVADVEVGSFLSSGIDSSYMAACLACENPAIKTFTVGFSEYEGERDEISWARELAAKLNVENDAERITEEEYWKVLPLVQWHMDEPSADPSAVALYFVDKIAARRVKAVLSGEGADEFFGGYRIYQAPLANEKVHWLPDSVLRLASSTLRAIGRRGANYLERASEQVEDWYYTNANAVAFSPDERDCLLASGVRKRLEGTRHVGGARRAIGLGARRSDGSSKADGEPVTGMFTPQQLTAPVYAEVAGFDETTRMQYVDLWFWLVGDILLKTDKMSMAHSLESRVPFLDREVFRVSASIPTAQKVSSSQTKLTLRQAAERAIPHDWAQKEKLGFPVPVAAWLRENRYYDQVKRAFTSAEAMQFFDVHRLLRLLDEHRAQAADHSRQIWIIYSFLIWYRVYFVDRAKPKTT